MPTPRRKPTSRARSATNDTTTQTTGRIPDVNEQAADTLRAAGADTTLDDDPVRVAGTQPHRGTTPRRR